MRLTSASFLADQPIPEEFAFGAPDPVLHVRLTTNHNPHLKWSGAPAQATQPTPTSNGTPDHAAQPKPKAPSVLTPAVSAPAADWCAVANSRLASMSMPYSGAKIASTSAWARSKNTLA